MERCTRCYMPITRPGSHFVDGVCGACRNYDKRKEIDWDARWQELYKFCDWYRGIKPYDCLIPVSGGKDSYTLVKIMVEDMGMHPLLCTVTDSFSHTQAGTHNLRNLIGRYNLNHWQYTISHDLFIRATRAAFEGTGEALKFVETAIYTIPYYLAKVLNIPLVVFGENSAYEYGSTDVEFYDANPTIMRLVEGMWNNSAWWTERGISEEELKSILPHVTLLPRVIYMSHFTPWSSVTNLAIAKARGFQDLNDTGEWKRQGTIEQFEQIDSVAYMVHLWLKYPKFGFQRAMDIASRRCREGLMSLDEVKAIAMAIDPRLDARAAQDFCDTLGYSMDEFLEIVNRWYNPEIFGYVEGEWQLK